MNRLTPEQVVEAYRVTGLRPRRETSKPVDGGCCALGAIAVKRGIHPAEVTQEYSACYMAGFLTGFDARDRDFPYVNPEEFRQGLQDGKAAAAAVGLD